MCERLHVFIKNFILPKIVGRYCTLSDFLSKAIAAESRKLIGKIKYERKLKLGAMLTIEKQSPTSVIANFDEVLIKKDDAITLKKSYFKQQLLENVPNNLKAFLSSRADSDLAPFRAARPHGCS